MRFIGVGLIGIVLLMVLVAWVRSNALRDSAATSDAPTPTAPAPPPPGPARMVMKAVALPPPPLVATNAPPSAAYQRALPLKSVMGQDRPADSVAPISKNAELRPSSVTTDAAATDAEARDEGDEEPALVDRRHAQTVLRALERGEGPAIQIHWPTSARDRDTLFNHLHRCLGMRLGRFDGQRLSAVEPGVTQTMSGFLRVSDGAQSTSEQQLLRRIGGVGTPVRLFPRRVDLEVLAGLSLVAGDGFVSAGTIEGRYVMNGSGWQLAHIRVDGRRVAGAIALPSSTHCSP